MTTTDLETLPYLAANIKCPRCNATAVSTGHRTFTRSTGHDEAAPDIGRMKSYRCVRCHSQTYVTDPDRDMPKRAPNNVGQLVWKHAINQAHTRLRAKEEKKP